MSSAMEKRIMPCHLAPKSRRQANQIHAARLLELASWIVANLPNRSEILAFCRDKWGISVRQADGLASRARRQVLEFTSKTQDVWRSEIVSQYTTLLRDDLKPRDRIAALRGLCDVLGVTPSPKDTAQSINVAVNVPQLDHKAIAAAQAALLDAYPSPTQQLIIDASPQEPPVGKVDIEPEDKPVGEPGHAPALP